MDKSKKTIERFEKMLCNTCCGRCEHDERSILSCPWYHGFQLYGWPHLRLKDIGEKLPDLRVEDWTEGSLKQWGHKPIETKQPKE